MNLTIPREGVAMFFHFIRFKLLYFFFLTIGLITSLCSCFSIKNYPHHKPFVYKTIIKFEGEENNELQKKWEPAIKQQLHDSIRPIIRQKFLVKKVMDKPPVYDSLNAKQSLGFISNLLHSIGYYSDSIVYHTIIDTVEDQQRATVYFTIFPGQLYLINSVHYRLLDSIFYSPSSDTLQNLVNRNLEQRAIKKGDAFALKPISNELDRISDLSRDNGYLRFSKDQLIVSWDTVGIDLLNPVSDPLLQFESLIKRIQNPNADLEIRLKPNPDTTRLIRYYVGKLNIYPDLNDSKGERKPMIEELQKEHYRFFHYGNRFRGKKMIPILYLTHGEMYRQSNYLRTTNKLSSIDAWKSVVINPVPRVGQDTVDFDIRLVPAPKYNLSADVEVSNNQGSIVSEGNLLGFGANLSLADRNLARGVNKSIFHLRYGIEFSPQLDSIQSNQFIIDYTISFPRLVPHFFVVPKSSRDEARTSFLSRIGFVDRIDYYTVRGISLSWGVQYRRKKALISIRFPNLEYNSLDPKQGLKDLIAENASYKYIFNDGLIASTMANITWVYKHKRITSILRVGAEEAGLITGLFRTLLPDSKFYRFIKLEGELVQKYQIRRGEIAWRVFGGAGLGLPFNDMTNGKIDSTNFYMPFYRQYYVGGPSSMRAWAVRKLGPGSTIKSYSKEIAPDRYGDMRLELNLEYRFFIASLFGTTLEGALFTDMGNIWFIRENNDFPEGEFRLKKLGKDLAIGAGTGLRIDLSFIKIRIDYAYKVKDPSPDSDNPESQNEWFYKWKFFNGQVQLGINYAF